MPSADEKPGILPLEIRKLVDSRRQVKQLMADKNLSVDLRMQVSSFYVIQMCDYVLLNMQLVYLRQYIVLNGI